MKHRASVRLHGLIHSWRTICSEELIALVLVIVGVAAPVSAATRFESRGLFMQSAVPGATTNYTITFAYMSPDTVGSIDMLFCDDPIPYNPCVPPDGLDVSQALLTSQSGESGYSITTRTANHLVLSRLPLPVLLRVTPE